MKKNKQIYRGYGMRLKCLYTILLYMLPAAVLFVACDRNGHEEEPPVPEGTGGVIVDLQPDKDIPAQDVHFFVFSDVGELVRHEYFDDASTVALHAAYLVPGSYTAVTVLNVGADFMPPSTRAEVNLPVITLTEFVDWVKTVSSQYPDLLTGIGDVEVEHGEVTRIVITPQKGTDGLRLPVLRLLLTLPDPRLPDYIPAKMKNRAAEAGYILRCVVELCPAGTDQVILHKPVTPVLQADGKTYLAELSAIGNDYDLRLWTDYARTDAPQSDTYYDTKNLNAVKITTEPYYTANTDAKDAAYYSQTGITLPPEGTDINIPLQRPLAKYRIIATDVEAYRKLRENDAEKFPTTEELTVKILYNGYFPSGFNVLSGKPNNAVGSIAYSSALPSVAQDEKEVQIGSDWVFVNGTESSVNVAIQILNKKGEVISRVENVSIAYRRNHNTTIKGSFLTAGQSGGNIHINTEWTGSYDMEF